jgi:hypothetical protein
VHASTSETVTLNVVLPADLVAALDDIVGAEGRNEFVHAAIGDRIRRMRAFRQGLQRLQNAAIPEWDTPESTAAWLREVRDWPDQWDDDALSRQRCPGASWSIRRS